ncbi:MAG: hypothetical protein OD815_000103 [Candidatus Alkanophagales archaeon MCA70_species_2]|nr:hypothetical protein [Candidatus Alkanophaga liquidiphilum]
MIRGVLARTDKKTSVPLIDDLSHHMLVVSAASLQKNDKEIAAASMIHDFFKGMMLWYQGERGANWWHFSPNPSIYHNILESLKGNIDLGKTTNVIIQHHHNRGNPIKKIERSQLVEQIEGNYFLFLTEGQSPFLKLIPLKLSGEYRFTVASLLHKRLIKKLSRAYAKRFKEVLGISRVKYIYSPTISFRIRSIEEIEGIVKELDIGEFRVEVKDDTLSIKLPVAREFGQEFSIEYYEGDTLIESDGVKISYGDALSMLTIGGSKDGALIYVDSGFDASFKECIEEFLREEVESWATKKNISVSADGVRNSISGELTGSNMCVFCGEPANIRYEFGKTFADAPQMMFSGDHVCPACFCGFLLEDQGTEGAVIPSPALVERYQLQMQAPVKEEIALSISGNFWLKTLSKLWLEAAKTEDGYRDAAFLLNPKFTLIPLTISFIPQFMHPAVRVGRRKKFILESSLRSGVICWGEKKDLTVEEFSEIMDFVGSNKDKAVECLRRLREIYGVRVLPKPPKRGGKRGRRCKGSGNRFIRGD